jgi:signal transduction histidine kinase
VIRRLPAVLLLALAYAVLARMGLALDAVGGFATLVWPPTGLSLAALWLWGGSLWPGVLLGAFAANVTAGAPPAVAAAIAAGNTLEALVGLMLLRRAGFTPALERVRDVLALVVAGLTVPLVSASVGVASLWMAGLVRPADLLVTLRTWWIGDGLAVLVVTPVLLTWLQRRPVVPVSAAPSRRARLLEAAALALVAAALAWLLFGSRPGPGQPFRQPFILFPLVVWAAVRMRLKAVTAVVLFLAGAAVAGTALGHGPFARDRLADGLAALQVFTAMLALGGLVLGALVAERTRAERALAEAVRVRDEFVSVASHELRTPLSVLSLDLERLAKTADKTADAPDGAAARGDRLRRSLRQVGRLNFLVENLLGASRIAHGRLHKQPRACDLSALAAEVVASFAGDPARQQHRIDLQVSGPIEGQWDPQLVEQAITNLVSNAVKYGQDRPITVTVRADGDRARVEVVDQGIGIEPQDLQRIFERFERAVAPRNFGGLGLGLYITRQIAQLHGGRVLVTSTPGKGSTFALELPLVTAPDAPAGSGPAPA